jgi:hypothetical protein
MADDIAPWDPFTSPFIRPSWHDKIKLVAAPKKVRIFGRVLVGKCCRWSGWNNAKNGAGGPYGIVRVNGERIYLHRYAYMQYHGVTLTPDQVVDHICRIRLCFNPLHVECTDYLENHRRGDSPAILRRHQFKKLPQPDLSDEDLEALKG